MLQATDILRNNSKAVVTEIQFAEIRITREDPRRNAFVAPVLKASVNDVRQNVYVVVCSVLIIHRDVLTLQGRSMEGSDVKQRDDDLARHGW